VIETVLRIGFSLLVVFGLMWGLAKLARRPLTGRGTGSLTVLTRQQLSRGSSIAVVQVADRAYLIGVTDTQVSMLGETELEAFAKHPVSEKRDHLAVDAEDHAVPAPDEGALAGSALSPRTWTSALDFLRERTARH
jgi:flagellar protein FliO/FliZ